MLKLRPLPYSIVGFEHFYLVVTWCHIGRFMPGPGTWGSLLAWPFCWLLKVLLGSYGLGLFAVITYFIGIKAIRKYEAHVKGHDAPEIVIDEVVGMMIVWLAIPLSNTLLAVAGFGLFRLFDIVKRGPVGWCDKNIKGPHGVMLDDVVAGFLASICVYVLAYLGV